MATDYSVLVPFARRRANFPAVASGGTDKIQDADVIRYLNRAFAIAAREILGIPRYVEFTVDTTPTIAVTKPTTDYQQPTVQYRSPELYSFPIIHVSDMFSLMKLENLTDPILNTDERIIPIVSIQDPRLISLVTSTGNDRFAVAAKLGDRGFYLGPATITQTNTIGCTYNGKFRQYSVSAVTLTTGSGLNDATIGGTYTNTKMFDDAIYRFTILVGSATDPNTYKTEKSTDGGTIWSTVAASTNMATTAVAIEDGLTVTWATTTGHTATDVLQFTAIAPSLVDLNDIDIFDEHECESFPVSYAAAQVLQDLKDTAWRDMMIQAVGPRYLKDGEPGGELLSFIDGRASRSGNFDTSLEDPQHDYLGRYL
jgi:hypothetical protein